MKKYFWNLFAVLLLVFVASCTPQDKSSNKNEANSDQGNAKQESIQEKSTANKTDNKSDGANTGSFQHIDYKAKTAPKFSADELKRNPEGDWLTNGGDLSNSRYSPLDSINTSNVKNLKAEWVTSLGSGFEFKYSGEATPIVYDGVMFTITGANHVQALDAKTGKIIWEYNAKLPDELDTVCCGWTSRGVALGDGKVFVGLLDARLIALDQKTGNLVWETRVDEWEKGYTITSAPLYYDGKVYTGVAGGEYGIRGYMAAYDSGFGREIWRKYTLPSPGEKGSETWPENTEDILRGGAPVWQTPAVDPELNMIYFSTGNTSPDLDGSNREGDNLFANSVMALDANTGEYKWHFQEVHHDIWDLDPANPVVLFDVEMKGKMRKGIVQAGKTGWLYILDRTNGEPLVGIEEKPVPQNEKQKTSPTQPIPIGDAFVPQTVTDEDVKRDLPKEFKGEIGSIFTPFWDKPVTLKPSPQGGANWPPSSYNPNTEYFYVLGNDNYFAYAHYGEEDENKFKEGKEYIGSVWQPVEKSPSRGTVTAMDIKTNKIVWQKKWDAIAYSGILTTKGNLLFTGHNDGRIIAYDATNGDEIWDFKMDAGANAPPITYEIDGKQYISIYAAGNTLAGSKHGDKIYTFSLEGQYGSLDDIPKDHINTSPVKHKAAKNEKDQKGPDKKVAANDGKTIYKNNCLACHGAEGAGGHNGPNLQETDMDLDAVINQVNKGSGSMPPFDQTLSKDEIHSVAEYVKSLSKK
ncbi:PQQ-binding-like beta-propeller repeat protein [Lederbergia wuyishanensis]|uniref:PQQ-dependent dehydrogenase (Methanol/ethanol family) n=1 Tax=Lederbergia wuyishanensis TaxID=1347903 RepID=A0ABU0D8N3_9BACI|nr:PQQ-binding-like beta-propeller repeat protein [Lederbergia wuyishanensis]MCJ8007648.1 PQQ-binding-like beta-propeller repeat protein [Lederbergia wuyishanensis]MDQ0344767.1 PQQ-dependent dehydrogenase (methanol/ethanol family) [Lederbergia wuyishanensis]